MKIKKGSRRSCSTLIKYVSSNKTAFFFHGKNLLQIFKRKFYDKVAFHSYCFLKRPELEFVATKHVKINIPYKISIFQIVFSCFLMEANVISAIIILILYNDVQLTFSLSLLDGFINSLKVGMTGISR